MDLITLIISALLLYNIGLSAQTVPNESSGSGDPVMGPDNTTDKTTTDTSPTTANITTSSTDITTDATTLPITTTVSTPTSPATTTPATTTPPTSSTSSTPLSTTESIVGVAVVIIILLLIIIFVMLCCYIHQSILGREGDVDREYEDVQELQVIETMNNEAYSHVGAGGESGGV